jgi:micrococcal nuclease
MKYLTKRQQKQLVSIGFTLIIAAVGWYANRHPSQTVGVLGNNTPGFYRVTRFYDGDTIAVNMNGKEEKIRMIGVDTPETHDPRKPVQCFGQAASEFTKQLIGAQSVRLETDSLSTNRDRYDRLLRYVYLPDGRLVEAEIIKNGYGFAYLGFPFTKSDEFKRYEAEARDSNRGLWGDCQPTTSSNGQIQSNPAQ